MGTAKRDRQRANRQSKLVAAQEAQRKSQSRRRIFKVGGAVVVLLVAALVYSLVAGNDDDGQDVATGDGSGTTVANTEPPTSTPTSVAVTAPPPGATISGETPCPPTDGSAERTTTFAAAPPTCIDPAKTYTATLNTSAGPVTIALDPAKAPLAVNNFVVLSRYRYYDGLPFHRIVTDFVAQVGDANPQNGAMGTGGPGYTFADELPDAAEYVPGVVAMANSGPDTNGSQFFIYVGPSNPFTSNPNYTIFGTVTEGMDTTVAAIMAAGSQDQGVTQVITIDSIDITEA